MLLSIVSATFAQSESYTIDDLRILAKENNFDEYLKHAQEVRPHLRSPEWNKLTIQMGVQFVNNLLEKKILKKEAFDRVENVFGWPVLKTADYFSALRNEFGLQYLNLCINQKREECKDDLFTFWNNTPKDNSKVNLAIKLINMTSNYLGNDNWPFYQVITTSDLADKLCTQNKIKEALFSKAQLLIDEYPDTVKLKQKLAELANDDCWTKTYDDLKITMFTQHLSQANVAYKILQLQNKLTQEEEDVFLTIFLLKAPFIGQTFNEAWNNLSTLGKNFERRKKVLKALTELTPLPDKSFAIPDTNKKEILLDHLAANIPEYFDYYARTCLAFIKGKKNFELGNPTRECRDLFASAKNKKWIEKNILDQAPVKF